MCEVEPFGMYKKIITIDLGLRYKTIALLTSVKFYVHYYHLLLVHLI